MTRKLLLIPLLLLVGCAAQNASTVPYHNIRLANADLAAALNKVESTALMANQQGIISTPETISVSLVINNLTIASDGIEKCVDTPPGTGTVAGCIAPLVQSIQSQMSLSGLGIKSSGATAMFNVVIAGVMTTLTEITAAEAQ